MLAAAATGDVAERCSPVHEQHLAMSAYILSSRAQVLSATDCNRSG
jgi:hypothetical protein